MKRTIIDASQLELTDKVVTIKRVTKTVKGGRNMRFTALVKEEAIKNLIKIAMDENNSITHDFIGKYGSSSVLLKKAPEGTGIIAGGPARIVCELAGIKNIRTKSLGSNNKQNVVLSTIAGLAQLKTPEEVAANRGKSIDEIMA